MHEFFGLYCSGLKHYLSFNNSNSRGKGHNKQAHKNNYKQKIRNKRGKR